MKKTDIYKLRELFEKIDTDFKNDTALQQKGDRRCRATLIEESTKKGVEICNKYINNMKPLR